MADQKFSKGHISAVIPPIMDIFQRFFYISKGQDSESDILLKYEIQYGGHELRWTPKIDIYISKVMLKLLIQAFFTLDIQKYTNFTNALITLTYVKLCDCKLIWKLIDCKMIWLQILCD